MSRACRAIPYGAGEQRAHATVTQAAEALGLEIAHDDAANLYMTLPGRDRAAASGGDRLASGFGAAWRQLRRRGRRAGRAGRGLRADGAGLTPACDIIVMGIRAEESVWFPVSYIGSRGSLGTLPDGALEVRRVDTGRTLADHMAACGANPDALRSGARYFRDPAAVRAYVELHIEQAPSLVEAGRSVAICTGIPGNFRFPDAWIEGRHDHVGLPRRFRRDAAMAGAEFAMALDSLWAEYEARGVPMACTFGRFHTDAAAHGMTIVPGAFHFSLDVRAYDEPPCWPNWRPRSAASSPGSNSGAGCGFICRRGRGPRSVWWTRQFRQGSRQRRPIWVSRRCGSAVPRRTTRRRSVRRAYRWG